MILWPVASRAPVSWTLIWEFSPVITASYEYFNIWFKATILVTVPPAKTYESAFLLIILFTNSFSLIVW